MWAYSHQSMVGTGPPRFHGVTILMFVKFYLFNAIFIHLFLCLPAFLVLKLLIQVLTQFIRRPRARKKTDWCVTGLYYTGCWKPSAAPKDMPIAIAHLKAGKLVIPNMSSVMLGKSVLF